MLPYIILFVVVIFLLWSGGENRLAKLNMFTYLTVGMMLVIFATIRSRMVGTDSNNYVEIYNQFYNNDGDIFGKQNSLGKGYLFVQQVASNFSSNYWSIFFVTALICVSLNLTLIYKLSTNIKVSVFVYMTLCTYFFMFNGARQALAASIVGYSIWFVVYGRKYPYYLIILVASTFHVTALIMLPFYAILRQPFKRKNILLYLIGGFLSLEYLWPLLGLLSEGTYDRYSMYESRNAQGGYLLTVFFIIYNIALLVLRDRIVKAQRHEYSIYLNMCLISSVIYIVTTFTGSDVNIIRLSMYFSTGYILILPITLRSVRLQNMKIVLYTIGVLHISFMCVYLMRFSDLYPYLTNKYLFG